MCLKTRVPFVQIGIGALQGEVETCIICSQPRPRTHVTAGRLYANGKQAFACNEHLWNKSLWLKGWAIFSITQKPHTHQPQDLFHILEKRPIPRLTDLANDVAYHLQVRKGLGKAIIITPRPAIFLAVLRKRWLKIIRILQRERASTLDPALISQFVSEIKSMQEFYFVCGIPENYPVANAYIVTPEQALDAPQLSTVYIASNEAPDFPSAQTVVFYE